MVQAASRVRRRSARGAALALVFSTVLALPASSSTDRRPTAEILESLGGTPCPEGSAFTCVTLKLPLDHFNPADERTLDAVFAVLPASGERKGMFVTVTGGPGSSGILSADDYVEFFDPRIAERFDIVFFDQRGIGRSGGVTCPEATATWYQADGRATTPEQEAAVKRTARDFARDCVEEIDPRARRLLPFLDTTQAVEDLERFRTVMDDDRLWLYGESYGSQYAQVYAATHGRHLAGMVIDGIVDLTLSGIDFFADEAKAMGAVLTATLKACNTDPGCAADTGQDGRAVYDGLVQRLRAGDIPFEFPLPSGGSATRSFSFADLEEAAMGQMTTESDRTAFNRALAAWAAQGDLVPLARLLYGTLLLDPESLAVEGDPGYSDAIYYGVDCRDYSYPGERPAERAEHYIRAGDAVEASVPRLASLFHVDLPCAYWPAAARDLPRPPPLKAEGIPSLVLGGTTDPWTPYHQAVDVFLRLDKGYLITKTNGPHVLYGREDSCVDGPVNEFLLTGRLPAHRETICEGAVAEAHIPLAPEWADAFENRLAAMRSADIEIENLAEYANWDGEEPTEVGCPRTGMMSFAPEGDEEKFTFNGCSFSRNFTLTGTGSYDPEGEVLTLKVTTTGRWNCDLRYRRQAEDATVSGPCRG